MRLTTKADVYNLRVLMARKNIIQSELADLSGLSLRTIANVCNARGVRPSTLGLVAKALGVDVQDIMAEVCPGRPVQAGEGTRPDSIY